MIARSFNRQLQEITTRFSEYSDRPSFIKLSWEKGNGGISMSEGLEVCGKAFQRNSVQLDGDLSTQDRLRSHAESFNGLLELIPAKLYYGEDTSVSFLIYTIQW